ncbi:SDR family oxidoreductase [Kaistella daneshvariae]|uniref:SDR family oxidoreductase n=1 Tax=Kaistella daneshvariae TaxID=2487074 RepID=A0ABM7CB16_9FLAO|nr:SDR family oxidoreductase [Kaistella daneshvariae]AZI68217.1 SDR family oxidoreductase [Kaistella daneshvariae]
MKNYALVTGSADRIGKSVALHLASQGYSLLLHYNSSAEKAEKVKHEIETLGNGVKAELLQFNFLADHDFDEIFAALKAKNIILDILVNCASDFVPSDFKMVGSQLLEKEFNINFKNAYLLTKAFARVYESGNIINFIDTKVTKNSTVHLDYILSKKLLQEFTKISAVELAPNFRVNGIAPGLILPPEGKDEGYLWNLAKNIPLKKIGNLDEINKAVQFIIVSEFFTGQTLFIDGGEHLI